MEQADKNKFKEKFYKGNDTSSSDHKFYVAFVGAIVGIFDSWVDIKPLVVGYPKNKHKSYYTYEEAEHALKLYLGYNDSDTELNNVSEWAVS